MPRERLNAIVAHQQRLHVARSEAILSVEDDVLVVRDVARLPREGLEGVVRQIRVPDPARGHGDPERVTTDPPHPIRRKPRIDVLLGNSLRHVQRVAWTYDALHFLDASGGLLENPPRGRVVASDGHRSTKVDVVAVQ